MERFTGLNRQLSAAEEQNNELAAKNRDMISFANSAKTEPAKSFLQTASDITAVKNLACRTFMERTDGNILLCQSPEELAHFIGTTAQEIISDLKLQLAQPDYDALIQQIHDEITSFGPLEPLLHDDGISEIMVNAPDKVYVERDGKLSLTTVRFENNAHIMAIAKRIVSRVGRHIDEMNPFCDARLMDGSRVNVVIPPCTVKSPTISIRKFPKRRITLDVMAEQNNISDALCKVLKVCGAARLNIIISGGTSSGKTTLLNALSGTINTEERIITIEDNLELQLQQPHVISMETRRPDPKGEGEITMQALVRNALRMRPDRIILGEVRGTEAFEILQAMNTGHDGSMCTVHANTPREAVTRLEHLISMGSQNVPPKNIRMQMAKVINLIIQTSRMRDGVRRVTHVTEVVGMEGDTILTQDIFLFKQAGEDTAGKIKGDFIWTGIRPRFSIQAGLFGLEKQLFDALSQKK